jgi:drug/metabolite transporter (DMT)-like permease
MYAWIDIITIGILIVSTGGLWNVIRATVYRATKDNEKYVTIWTIFMVAMAALCAVFYAAFRGYETSVVDGPAGWAFFAACYCGLAAVLTFVGLLLTGAESAIERLTEIVRGE